MQLKKIITFAILGTLIVLCGPAYGEIFSQSHNDTSGVTITTTVDTDRRSVLYEYDFRVLGSASYEQIKIGQPGFPTSTIDRHPSRDPESPSATGYIYFEGEAQFQVEYKTGADPPAVNWIKLHYVAGYRFDRFDPPNNSIQVTYRVPPPGQEDNIFVGAYTPVIIQVPPNQPPSADPNGPYAGTEDSPVSFDGTGSSDLDGTIVSYAWDFGDTGTGTGASPTHTYATAGLYTVSLTVTDDGGLTATASTTADIQVPPNQPPTADPNGPYSGTEGIPVSFDGTGSSDGDGTIVSYAWDFGDTGTGTGASPTHTYATAGLYTVSLTVTDDGGLTATASTTADIQVPNQAPVADDRQVGTAEDTAVAITLSGNDVDGEAISFIVMSAPANGTLIGTAPTLTYVPNAEFNGSDRFTFKVSDGTLDSTVATVSISVTAVNDAPLISGSPVTHVDEFTPYSFTPDAADIDQDSLTFSINRIPSWADFDSGSGRLSGTPGSTDVGTFGGIVITVTDGNASASLPAFDLTVVNVSTDLRVQQTVDNPTPSVNETVVFTIAITNNDPSAAPDVSVTDILPSGLSYVSDDSGGDYDPAGGRWQIGDIPAGPEGNTAVLNIFASVNRAGALINIASVTDSELIDLNPADNSSAVILNGEYQSDLGISVTVDNAVPEVGDLIIFTVMISNNGLDDAAGVQVIDVLPAGLTYVGDDSGGLYDTRQGLWDVGVLPSGVGETLNLTATVESADEIINSTTITSNDQIDPDITNNQVSQVINQNAATHSSVADLAIQIAVNQSVVEVGQEALFTVLVRNLGPDAASGIIIESLLLDGMNLISSHPSRGSYNGLSGEWAIDTIEVGSYAAVDIVAEVSAAVTFSNVASVIYTNEFDPNEDNNLSEAFVTGIAADLSVYLTVDPPSSNLAEHVVYSIVVTNSGPDEASGILITDLLPDGLEYQTSVASSGSYDSGTGDWEISAIGNGEHATLDITAIITKTGIISNRAIRTSSMPTDINPANDSMSVPLSVAVDGDEDGMPDEWEAEHGLNLALNDADDDLDGDGLLNIQEYDNGTDPNLSDTDSDEMPDAWEVVYGLNPLIDDADDDNDTDGYTNLEEFQSNTRPNDSDSRPQSPVAVAGCPDQAVTEGVQVLLSGSNSFDPDNDIAEYGWEQIWGREVNLSDPDMVQPTFISPQVDPGGATLTFRLTVTDRLGQLDTADCIVIVSWENEPPQANAGPNQTVGEGLPVVLDGSGSTDPDDGIHRYVWSQISGPAVQLSDTAAIQPIFWSPPLVGSGGASLGFLLQVFDKNGLQDTDSCTINVTWDNDPPTAHAGDSQTVVEGVTVTLDGSAATDADDGIQRYIWSQISGSKQVTLSDATAVKPTFVTPTVAVGSSEQLGFLLQVFDNGGLSDTAVVMIEVTDNGIIGFSEDVLATVTVTDQYVGISVLDDMDPDNGGNLVSFTSLSPDSVSDTNGMPDNLIYGLFDIKVKTYFVGGEIRIKVQLENPAPPDYRWYKYNSKQGWYDYSAYAEFNAERNEVILTLVDGGIGDDDETANGIIIDPSGLGIVAQSTTAESPDAGGGGGGGGCFIDSAGEGSFLSLSSLVGSLSLLSLLGLLAQINPLRSSSSKSLTG